MAFLGVIHFFYNLAVFGLDLDEWKIEKFQKGNRDRWKKLTKQEGIAKPQIPILTLGLHSILVSWCSGICNGVKIRIYGLHYNCHTVHAFANLPIYKVLKIHTKSLFKFPEVSQDQLMGVFSPEILQFSMCHEWVLFWETLEKWLPTLLKVKNSCYTY